MKKERLKPMPTDEEKMKAKLKAAGADPLVWAMKSVDNKFPDTREKNVETIKAEAAVEEPTEIEEDLDADEPMETASKEIKAESKTALPTDEGVVTMEVKPMRQDVSNVSAEEKDAAKKVSKNAEPAKKDDGKKHEAKKVEPKKVKNEKKPVIVSAPQKFAFSPMMIAGIVCLALLAIGGVSFGIVAMVRQNKATEEFENQIASVVSQKEETVDGDYVTLKDWDLKIKVASGLTNLSYNYQSDNYAEVQFWGAKKDGTANYTPDFAKQTANSSPLGTVVRVPRYERAAAGRLIWYDDYYNYYYQGPSGVPNVSESEMSWWVESYLLIKDMLTNADNYVKIDADTVGQQ